MHTMCSVYLMPSGAHKRYLSSLQTLNKMAKCIWMEESWSSAEKICVVYTYLDEHNHILMNSHTDAAVSVELSLSAVLFCDIHLITPTYSNHPCNR